MPVRNLTSLCNPHSIALIGASATEGTVGSTVLHNLMSAGFDGPIRIVNPKRDHIGPYPCHQSIADLPEAPELAVIAAPAATVPDVIDELGARGTRGAVIITAGLGKGPGSLGARTIANARRHDMRLLGPNCIGLLVPEVGLNASFAHINPMKGEVAFLSQSGALVTTVVDWAHSRGIGFRSVVSLGDVLDVDVADLLDYFAADVNTRSILLYLEAITDARSFLSAARRAARVKPVIAIKGGRNEAAARAAASHTGALAASDAVFDAALRRAGVLRVFSLDELFTAAETVSRIKPFPGNRLGIVTNGGGAGVLAADALDARDASLSQLAPETVAALDAVLPSIWSRGNPVDIIGDAPPERYKASIQATLEDPNTDAVLVINCPTALTSPNAAAEATIAAWDATHRRKPLFGCWLGDGAAREARQLLASNGVPNYETPSASIEGIRHVIRYRNRQELLTRMPPALPEGAEPDRARVEAIVKRGLAGSNGLLTSDEAKALLAAYHIPVALAEVARDPADVARVAAGILSREKAVALKIRSADITHKSDVGGVRLGLRSAKEAEASAVSMLETAKKLMPNARIDGFTVEPMVVRPNGIELIAGVATDPLFGPIILFGAGGTAVEVLADRSIGLPPLDALLARDMISETRVAKLLAGYRDRPKADHDAIVQVLLGLSRMLVEIPEIIELDINPLLADDTGAVALDARVRVAAVKPGRRAEDRFAIRPYPSQWISQDRTSGDLDVHIRPVKPEDEALYEDFFANLTPEDIRLRFFAPVKELSHKFMARLTQLDYQRSMAFMALSPDGETMLGVSRLALDPDHETGEYAVIVRSDLKGRGLGWLLMRKLIEFAAAEGVSTIFGDVLSGNRSMLTMCRDLGFSVERYPGDASVVRVSLDVADAVDKVAAADRTAARDSAVA
ncbi:MAG: bifunctional acetate--CoA ligase family protein/GNAT family N-acetyltransferase [Hyphomicrobiales bacterium]